MATRCQSAGFIEFKLDFAASNHLAVGDIVRSDDFSAGGHLWRVICYPKGDEVGNGNYLSLYLRLVSDSKSEKIKAIIDAFLLGRNGAPSSSSHGKRWVHVYSSPDGSRSRGFPEFVKRSVLDQSDCVTDGFVTFMVVVIVLRDSPMAIPVPSSDIADHLGRLLDHANDGSTDVTFTVGTETFHAHRAVLAARSPVFKAQLFGSMADAKITLQGIRPEVFRILLRFMYTDAFPGDDSDNDNDDAEDSLPRDDDDEDEQEGYSDIDLFQDLLAAADMYHLDRLKLMCARKLWDRVSGETVAKLLVCAELRDCSELKSACLDFFLVEKNFKVAVLTDGYLQLMQSFPSVIAEIKARVRQI
ncbi:BTB/POZ and MATH domain-containing protein 1 [Zea mays]|jgi:speckle-type POZ protein|uniref:BTB/POZ and MATH domain-containing protein 1 n=2 Tax=Zea mays TaxID=4577 RepID=A0A8J8XXL0_MAIZE|nr:BTB/POZ and MATH domain-containing protein 1 [Zea mays]AQK51371.1 BTB/POZ and MATH domain-containing protein 1 [Zea mays]PWZ26228.1 BTB/POZ and MATH domain-containing protein 1 [Zea mays]|eukprot:XP_020407414.1 BTB/POZ and MATH domain-containing protein 1 [Zea mays]